MDILLNESLILENDLLNQELETKEIYIECMNFNYTEILYEDSSNTSKFKEIVSKVIKKIKEFLSYIGNKILTFFRKCKTGIQRLALKLISSNKVSDARSSKDTHIGLSIKYQDYVKLLDKHYKFYGIAWSKGEFMIDNQDGSSTSRDFMGTMNELLSELDKRSEDIAHLSSKKDDDTVDNSVFYLTISEFKELVKKMDNLLKNIDTSINKIQKDIKTFENNLVKLNNEEDTPENREKIIKTQKAITFAQKLIHCEARMGRFMLSTLIHAEHYHKVKD